MDRVAMIMDMDGFQHEGDFLCRELGVIQSSRTRAIPISRRFRLNHITLSSKDWRTAMYVGKRIHGLRFRARERDAKPLEQLEEIVERFYEGYRRPGKNVVAYKGGRYERQLLSEMNIPSLNLEKFGCPRFEELLTEADLEWQCPWHSEILEEYRHRCHCVRSEVSAFNRWMLEQLEEL